MYYMIMISNYFSMFREAFKKINILMMMYENFIDKIEKKESECEKRNVRERMIKPILFIETMK